MNIKVKRNKNFKFRKQENTACIGIFLILHKEMGKNYFCNCDSETKNRFLFNIKTRQK